MAHPVLVSQSYPYNCTSNTEVRSKGSANILHLLRNREIGKSIIKPDRIIPNFAQCHKTCEKIIKEIQHDERVRGIYRTQVNSKEVSTLNKIVAPLADVHISIIQLKNFGEKVCKEAFSFSEEEIQITIPFEALKNFSTIPKINELLRNRCDSKWKFSIKITNIHSEYRKKIDKELIGDFENEFQERIERSISNNDWESSSNSVIDSLISYITVCEEREKAILTAIESRTITTQYLEQKKNEREKRQAELVLACLVALVAISVLSFFLDKARELVNT